MLNGKLCWNGPSKIILHLKCGVLWKCNNCLCKHASTRKTTSSSNGLKVFISPALPQSTICSTNITADKGGVCHICTRGTPGHHHHQYMIIEVSLQLDRVSVSRQHHYKVLCLIGNRDLSQWNTARHTH